MKIKAMLPYWHHNEKFFKSKSHYVMFILTETDKEYQMEQFGIKDSKFHDKERAKKWFLFMNDLLIEDHPRYYDAHEQLTKLYRLILSGIR